MIRAAKKEDHSQILDLAKSTLVFTPEEIECLDQDVAHYFTSDKEALFVYEEQAKVLGFAEIGPLAITDRSWILYWIAVAKDAQKLGVGKKLIEYAESLARCRQVRLLLIETSSSEKFLATRCFYLRNGFSQVCSIPDYYSDGDHKVVFSKKINI